MMESKNPYPFANHFRFDNVSNPSPILGEGGPRKWWVRVCFELKKRGIFEFGVAPHPAYSATFSLMA